MIVRRGGKFFVDSQDGSKVLGGPYDTEAEARKRLAEIEHYKTTRGDATPFAVGDRVRVRAGMAHEPEPEAGADGNPGTVKIIEGEAYGVLFDGSDMVHKWYVASELEPVPAEGAPRGDADWDTNYINNLPDSAFLYVAPGGSKDDGGKTVPRSLRHFPFRNAQGGVDLPHLRNALARIPQSDVPADVKAAATKKGQAALVEANGGARGDTLEVVTRFDAIERFEPARRMDNGWLEADAVITRSGVFKYRNPDGSPRLEYRPPEEVGRADSLASFELTPVTDDHPDTVYPDRPHDNGLLRASNTSAYARGTVAGVRRDGDLVRARLRVTDERTITKMDAGKVATSCGYTCSYDPTPGVAPDGTRYHGVQRNIRGNHVAIVDVGRAGPEARVRMDAAGRAIDVPECLTGRGGDATLPLAILMPTGAEMTDIEKLQAAAKDAVLRADKAEADLKLMTARADKAEAEAESLKTQVAKLAAVRTDSEQIGELKTRLDATVVELEAERAARKIAEDPTRFSAAVQRRAKVEGAALKVLGKEFRCDGTDRAIMLAVVEKVEGKIDASRSDEYVESRFDSALAGWERGEAALATVRTMVTAPAARQDGASLPDTRSARQKMIDNMNTLAPVK